MSLPERTDLDDVTLYSTVRAAELLDISERSIRRLMADGHLETVVILSKRRIPLRSLRSYVARQTARGRVRPLRRAT